MTQSRSSVVEERCYPYIGDYKTSSKCKVARGIRSLKAARCLPQHSIEPPRLELYRTGPAYRIKSEQDIMHEILESGPVQGELPEYTSIFAVVYKYVMVEIRSVCCAASKWIHSTTRRELNIFSFDSSCERCNVVIGIMLSAVIKKSPATIVAYATRTTPVLRVVHIDMKIHS